VVRGLVDEDPAEDEPDAAADPCDRGHHADATSDPLARDSSRMIAKQSGKIPKTAAATR
jgi:hypothetical protein